MAGTDVMGKGAHPDFSKPNGLGDLVSISGSEKPWWSWLLNYWRTESFNKAVDPHFAGWELRNMAFLSVCLVSKSCLTLCYPMDCSLSGSSVHGDFSGKNTGVGCHFLLQGTFPTQGSSPHLLSLLHCGGIQNTLPSQYGAMGYWIFQTDRFEKWHVQQDVSDLFICYKTVLWDVSVLYLEERSIRISEEEETERGIWKYRTC